MLSAESCPFAGNILREKHEICPRRDYEFGLNIPDKIALLTSWPLMKVSWIAAAAGREYKGRDYTIHMGLLHLKAYGGWREATSVSQGYGIGFHFGAEHILSILKLEVEWFQQKPLPHSQSVPIRGLNAVLGLTWVF